MLRRLIQLILVTLPLAAAAQTLPPLEPRADRYVIAENAAPAPFDVVANDALDAARLSAGEVVVSVDGLGSTAIVAGDPGTAADDRIRYAPPADFSGIDRFTYRVCEGVSGGRCQEAQVTVLVRPAVDVFVQTTTGSGFADVRLTGLRALPDASFATTPLVVPYVGAPVLDVDPTPETPWDDVAGTGLMVRSLPEPANGQPQTWRLVVDGSGIDADIDLYVGRDANGDDMPDGGELLCTAAMATGGERCDVEFVTRPGIPVRYWVMAHNRGPSSQAVRLLAFEVPMRNGEQALVASGPGQLPADAAFAVRVGWTELSMVDGSSRLGFVRVLSEGNEVGVFPVRLDRNGSESSALALTGAAVRMQLTPGQAQERIFVDVPEGARGLRVVLSGSVNGDLYLARVDAPEAPRIALAPPRAEADYSATGAGGLEVIEIGPNDLEPGRWYVTPVNAASVAGEFNVQASITDRLSPWLRGGSYFNPDRAGHGLFLYPAGDDWAGVWFTYLQDGTPTWYWIQGRAPQNTGTWRAGLYRSSWHAAGNLLISVGQVQLTASADDAFVFTYRLDGEVGSEPMTLLGNGCPRLDGFPLDVSSLWFNPASAGTGFAVQMWPDYEYHAAFVYDAFGVARFLTGESHGFGGADDSLVLEQLRGFCPLCDRAGDPERVAVGSYVRRFANRRLTEVAIDAAFADAIAGEWLSVDAVQLLGGQGSTQGCND